MHDPEGERAEGDFDSKELRSVMQQEQKAVDEGKLIAESFNQGLSAFNPDIMFENLVNNYSMAKKMYGETLIRLMSGYDSSYLERNINIPEFKRELKKKLIEKLDALRDKGLLDNDLAVTEQGVNLASFVLFSQELDKLMPKGTFGEKEHLEISHYGEKMDYRGFKKGDRYKDIDIKRTLKMAIRRGHSAIAGGDLITAQRQSKGRVHLIYALDASGSMKGRKIDMCKKAGIALCFKAIERKDKVGLLVFGSEVKEEVEPTDDFPRLLRRITQIRASRQTDFTGMLRRCLELFPKGDVSKHLLILTDAMPTVGDDPQKQAIEEVAKLRNAGVTVSLIGINLDTEARGFAERLTAIGDGKLYIVRHLEELDTIVLEDYYAQS
ncbi:MAG: VWA domain-containing protein [Nanoarchaeota archaeon]|nr:VWA domain-containing protein [Nanoarchaeota archaeon]